MAIYSNMMGMYFYEDLYMQQINKEFLERYFPEDISTQQVSEESLKRQYWQALDSSLAANSTNSYILPEAFYDNQNELQESTSPDGYINPGWVFNEPYREQFTLKTPVSCGGLKSQIPIIEPELYYNFKPENPMLPKSSRQNWKLVMKAFQDTPTNFISIDFEGQLGDRNGITQVGVTNWHMTSGKQTTLTFLWGISENLSKQEKYATKKGQKFEKMKAGFNFEAEDTELSSLKDVADNLNSILQLCKERGGVTLVVHGGVNDLQSLRYMKVNLKGIPVLDTQRLDHELRGYGNARRLDRCLDGFKIPYKNLHNAGNE